MSNPPPLAFIVRSKLIFEKLDNGNVLLRKYGTSEIIASFPPNQIVTKDISSISNIIIKSALTNERGVVINVKNIDVAHCTPVIASSYIDDIISDLSNLFFF